MRDQLTKKQLEILKPSEIASLKLTATEKLIIREINSERECERRQELVRISEESRLLLLDLQNIGLDINSIGDLVSMRTPYSEAIPILLRHLVMPYSDAVKSTIARSLAVPEELVKKAWPILVNEFKDVPSGRGVVTAGGSIEKQYGAKQALACVLSAAVTQETLDDLVEIIKDTRHGSSRILLLSAVRKFNNARARGALRTLSQDPMLKDEISSWSQKKVSEKEKGSA